MFIYLLQSIVLLLLTHHKVNAELTYSFAIPKQYGTLTLEEANCCPYLGYAKNDTTSENQQYPTLIGLGSKKSGTTSIYFYIKEHPEYVIPCAKELHFLTSNKGYDSVSDFLNAINPIQDMEQNKDKHLLFELTPFSIYMPMAACRARYFFPDMKFLVILRDPISRTHSNFNFERNNCVKLDNMSKSKCDAKFNYGETIEKGLQIIESRKCTFNTGYGEKTWNDCYGCLTQDIVVNPECHDPKKRKLHGVQRILDYDTAETIELGELIISSSLYAPQIAWWYNFFNPSQFLFINTESFEEDPVSQYESILNFINYDNYVSETIHSMGKTNKASYPETREPDIDYINGKLYEFFERPTLELIQLMHSTGHGYFNQFEKFQAANKLNEMNSISETNEVMLNIQHFEHVRIIRQNDIVEYWPSSLWLYVVTIILITTFSLMIYFRYALF